MDFKKHLFISYAHLDNEPPTEQQHGSVAASRTCTDYLHWV